MRKTSVLFLLATLPFFSNLTETYAKGTGDANAQISASQIDSDLQRRLGQLARMFTFAKMDAGQPRIDAMREILAVLDHILEGKSDLTRHKAFVKILGEDYEHPEAVFLGYIADAYIRHGISMSDSMPMFAADMFLRRITGYLDKAGVIDDRSIMPDDYHAEKAKIIYGFLPTDDFNSPEKFTQVWSDTKIAEANKLFTQGLNQFGKTAYRLLDDAERRALSPPSGFLLPMENNSFFTKHTYSVLIHPLTGLAMTEAGFQEIMRKKALEAARELYRQSQSSEGKAKYEALANAMYYLSKAGYHDVSITGEGLDKLTYSNPPTLASYKLQLQEAALNAAMDTYNQYVKPYFPVWRERGAQDKYYISRLEENIGIVMGWISKAASARGENRYGIDELRLPENEMAEIRAISEAYRKEFGNSQSIGQRPHDLSK